MDYSDLAEQFFTYDARLASFQTAQPTKKRGSTAKGRAAKGIAWPHKYLDPADVSASRSGQRFKSTNK